MPKSKQHPARRIVIAGASGAVGSVLVRSMAQDPIELIGLTRDANKVHFPKPIQVAEVDFTSHASLRRGVAGADTLFLAQGGSPDQARNEMALIDAAVAEGVRHIVKLSAFGPASPLYPMNLHMQIEAHLAAQPIAYTLLRPGTYTHILRLIAPYVATGRWGGAITTGRVNYIDVRDVAEVARLALLERVETDAKRAFHLTGPRSWSTDELAEKLSKMTGTKVIYRVRSRQQQREFLLDQGLPPARAELLLGLDQLFRDAGVAETTATVAELTGHPPRPITDWLQENLATFTSL